MKTFEAGLGPIPPTGNEFNVLKCSSCIQRGYEHARIQYRFDL